MIKIVGGKYRSRNIEVPQEGTVPTKARVREAMLSMVCPYLEGARVLDLFAGSGALGIECLSRGASSCLFVDSSQEAANIIRKNLESLGETKGAVLCQDYVSALSSQVEPFDVVFLDPPYANKEAYNDSLSLLLRGNLLTDQAMLLLEYEGEIPPLIEGYLLVKEKKYGYTKVVRLRKE